MEPLYQEKYRTNCNDTKEGAEWWVANKYSSHDSVSEMHVEQPRLALHRVLLLQLTSRDVIQIQCGLVAVPMASYFERPKKITHQSHNNTLGFRQVYTSAEYYRCSVYPKTIALWKKLPAEAVLLTDLDSFKRATLFLSYF